MKWRWGWMGGAIIILTRVLSCTCTTKEASVLGVWSILSSLLSTYFLAFLKISILTCVYGISTWRKWVPNSELWVTAAYWWKCAIRKIHLMTCEYGIEDCEGWQLSGCCTSVVSGKELVAQMKFCGLVSWWLPTLLDKCTELLDSFLWLKWQLITHAIEPYESEW